MHAVGRAAAGSRGNDKCGVGVRVGARTQRLMDWQPLGQRQRDCGAAGFSQYSAFENTRRSQGWTSTRVPSRGGTAVSVAKPRFMPSMSLVSLCGMVIELRVGGGAWQRCGWPFAPASTNRATWLGVNGARRSHFEYASRTMPSVPDGAEPRLSHRCAPALAAQLRR